MDDPTAAATPQLTSATTSPPPPPQPQPPSSADNGEHSAAEVLLNNKAEELKAAASNVKPNSDPSTEVKIENPDLPQTVIDRPGNHSAGEGAVKREQSQIISQAKGAQDQANCIGVKTEEMTSIAVSSADPIWTSPTEMGNNTVEISPNFVPNEPATSAVDPNNLPCPTCGKPFPTSKRRDHLATSHLNHALREYVRNGRQCPLCDYSTNTFMLARHVGLAHRKLEEFATPEQLVWMKTGANNRGNNKQQQAASALQLASQAIALPTVPIPPSAAVIAGTSASPTTSTGLASRLTGTSVEQPMMTQQQLTKPPTAAAIAASKGMTLPRASCPTCGKQFPAGVSKRKAHLASSHANRALKAFVKSNKQCQLCSYTSSSIGIVARHVGIVHGKLEDFATAAEMSWVHEK